MKRCIYVVDDQLPVLETAVMILRGMDAQWEVAGFSDPLEALAAVKVKAPDLILSDQLMPGMQGSQLLEEVRNIAPAVIRVIMSGYVSLSKLTLITSAHQYMAKPFDIGKLRDLVQRSFAAQERIVNKGLQTVATSLRSIPSLPQVHQSLLAELEDTSTASSTIARMVAEDAGLSIKVLQLANSPLFGQGYLITNPTDAVMCLGTEMIAAIVLSQSLFRTTKRCPCRSWICRGFGATVGRRPIWPSICRQKGFPPEGGGGIFWPGCCMRRGDSFWWITLRDNSPTACQGGAPGQIPVGAAFAGNFPDHAGAIDGLFDGALGHARRSRHRPLLFGRSAKRAGRRFFPHLRPLRRGPPRFAQNAAG
jgi:CheY-like chemotaxis protein